ncbi:MAG: beta-lactamase family protein [Clostridia bacterium]|nr:beta-lactamase family protein [Clostridia bacterium]
MPHLSSLRDNMRYLCDESRMLAGLTIAYGTQESCEFMTYGRAQETVLEHGQFRPCIRPLQEDSLYDLASLTKLFTSVMAVLLMGRGMLSADERIGSIDPRFTHLNDVTVFDVLCYRACLQTPGRIDAAPTREEGLRRLFGVMPAPLPAVRIYSDINAMVIKYVVEAKTGMAFYDALKVYILDPAGMTETCSAVPAEQLSRCVCYNYEHRIVRDRHILRTDTLPGTPHDPKAMLLSDGGRDLCGHAGLFSSRQDMVRFAQALLSGSLLTREQLISIGTDRTGRDNGDGTYRQPLGFLCFTKHPVQRLSEVPAHMGAHSFGLSGFTGNHIVLDPQTGIFEIFLGNRCHARISHITPPEGRTMESYGLDDRGAALIPWEDGRKVPTSARYVYLKDACLHEPIVQRMHQLGWLA